MTLAPETASEERLLGSGLACAAIDPGSDIGRDLSLTEGKGGLDLARSEGLENLVQCLEIALTTASESDVFNTAFGFDGINALTSPDSALLARERVRIAVINTLTADQRVSRIVDLKLLDGRLEAVSQSSATGGSLAASRTLSVRVSFVAISGAQAEVDVGRLLAGG